MQAHTIDPALDQIVVVSDIHSVQPAIEGFEDVFRRMPGRSQIVFNGDLFGMGAEPVETTDWVREKAGDLATIGNHDEKMLKGGPVGKPWDESGAYHLLGKERRDYVRARPHRLELTWRGKRLAFMHGDWNEQGRACDWAAPSAEVVRNFGDPSLDLVCTAHTHYPFVQEVHESIVANSGSMCAIILGSERKGTVRMHHDDGSPAFEQDTRSSFLTITHNDGELHVEVIRFEYDREMVIRRLMSGGYPRMERLTRFFRDGIVIVD